MGPACITEALLGSPKMPCKNVASGNSPHGEVLYFTFTGTVFARFFNETQVP